MQTPTPSRRTKRGCSVGALASTLVDSSVCYETDKKARRIRVKRLPTAYLLLIVAQTEIRHIRLKGSLGQNTLLLVAEKVNCRVSRPLLRSRETNARLWSLTMGSMLPTLPTAGYRHPIYTARCRAWGWCPGARPHSGKWMKGWSRGLAGRPAGGCWGAIC